MNNTLVPGTYFIRTGFTVKTCVIISRDWYIVDDNSNLLKIEKYNIHTTTQLTDNTTYFVSSGRKIIMDLSTKHLIM